MYKVRVDFSPSIKTNTQYLNTTVQVLVTECIPIKVFQACFISNSYSLLLYTILRALITKVITFNKKWKKIHVDCAMFSLFYLDQVKFSIRTLDPEHEFRVCLVVQCSCQFQLLGAVCRGHHREG